jgi:hypothetical protein
LRGQEGVKGPKKTVTLKPLTYEQACTFNFTVWKDTNRNCFYTKIGYGCSEHCFHDRLESSETRLCSSLTTEDDAKLIAQLVDHSAGIASIQSLYHE